MEALKMQNAGNAYFPSLYFQFEYSWIPTLSYPQSTCSFLPFPLPAQWGEKRPKQNTEHIDRKQFQQSDQNK